MAFFYFFPFFLVFLGSCGSTYLGEDLCGADEFVLDSYKIGEGKLAILEMKGIVFDELEEDLSETPGFVTVVGNPKTPIDGKMRLLDVLTNVSLEHINFFKSYIVRKEKILPVDFGKLFEEGDFSQNILLQDGDTIYLAPEDSVSCIVIGEEGFQKEVFLKKGSMSLRKALFEGRSLPLLNENLVVRVFRGALQKPKIYALDWEHIRLLPDSSLLVMSGDVIYISRHPFSKWDRFISGLLPINIQTD